jgi:hypothetical protein
VTGVRPIGEAGAPAHRIDGMAVSILSRVPVVGALGYIEHVRTLPASFTATLVAEPENRYFRHAIAVTVNGRKAGYVAPEVAATVFDSLVASATPVTCSGRRGSAADHATSGVELLLDFSSLSLTAAP